MTDAMFICPKNPLTPAQARDGSGASMQSPTLGDSVQLPSRSTVAAAELEEEEDEDEDDDELVGAGPEELLLEEELLELLDAGGGKTSVGRTGKVKAQKES